MASYGDKVSAARSLSFLLSDLRDWESLTHCKSFLVLGSSNLLTVYQTAVRNYVPNWAHLLATTKID